MEAKLNNELLKKDDEKTAAVKRNSKQELINKIVQVAEQNELVLELSDTKLQRLTKQQLNELLAETVEKAMRNSGPWVWVDHNLPALVACS